MKSDHSTNKEFRQDPASSTRFTAIIIIIIIIIIITTTTTTTTTISASKSYIHSSFAQNRIPPVFRTFYLFFISSTPHPCSPLGTATEA
jgi:hypothetical protein